MEKLGESIDSPKTKEVCDQLPRCWLSKSSTGFAIKPSTITSPGLPGLGGGELQCDHDNDSFESPSGMTASSRDTQVRDGPPPRARSLVS
jgi:hypothetical protein